MLLHFVLLSNDKKPTVACEHLMLLILFYLTIFLELFSQLQIIVMNILRIVVCF